VTVCAHTARCQTSGCRGRASVLCQYPVIRHGRAQRCGRHICAGCAKRIEGKAFCPPHARTGVDALVKICPSCYMASCPGGEMRCESPGKPRLVTAAEWKRLLCFGVP
jgi:hypothetical protein